MNLTIRLITAMLLVSCLWVRGEDAYVSPVTGQPFRPGGKFTLEQIKARDERVLKKTGGFINLKAEGPLALFVDARAKATLTVDEVQRLYRLGTHLDCNTLKLPRGADTPLAYARKQMATRQPLLLVAVIEGDETLPALSIFPEERIGLVNAVYPQAELMENALKLANKIARNAPIAVRACKQAVNEGMQVSIEEGVAIEEKLFGACFETHDQVEGMACFLSREKPKPKAVFTNN